MDKTQKIITALLIVAILFSVVSIAINLVASNISIQRPTGEQAPSSNSAGTVGLFVEGNNVKNSGER